jgi:hypothetical protein
MCKRNTTDDSNSKECSARALALVNKEGNELKGCRN